MRNTILFISFLLLFVSGLCVHAESEFPSTIREFNAYLLKVDSDERIGTYSEIIENIDTLIQETNTSKNLTKLQKRKLIAQYRIFRNRTYSALKREQKKTQVSVNFQKIIQRNTSSWANNIYSWVTIQSGSTSSPIFQNTIEQRPANTQNNNISTVPNISSTTPASNTGITNTVPKNRDIIISSWWTQAYYWISSNSRDSLWSFSLTTSDENVRISKLVFRNIWTARLKDVIWEVRLWNYENLTSISLASVVQDNKLYLVSLQEDISKWAKKTYGIQGDVWSILGFFGKTIQLEWIPEESEIYPYTYTNTGYITYGTWNIINNSSFPVVGAYWLAPEVWGDGNNGNRGQGSLTFNNWNQEFDVTINSIKLEIVKNEYGNKLNGLFYLTWAFNWRFQLVNDSENSIVNIDSSILGAGITVKKGVPFVLNYSLDWSYSDFYPRIIISEVIYTALWKKFKASRLGMGNMLNNPTPID